ncbi:MAG TPA: hypothetical protein PLQ67_03570 [Burkholderiaceae bacterium]|nr:hypothetical protein [Burkholderiaceae bacterium]
MLPIVPLCLLFFRHLTQAGKIAASASACLSFFLLSACASLLPAGSNDTRSSFASFEEAKNALETIVPYETTTEQVKALGFDYSDSANVTIITYPDVIAHLAPNASVPMEALDPGIRDCILAQTRCKAYEFGIERIQRKRVGRFWADFMNFRRTVEVSGWRFNAMIVVRNGVVLFRRYGGEPNISRTERYNNPLGPLQGAGEAVAGRVVR